MCTAKIMLQVKLILFSINIFTFEIILDLQKSCKYSRVYIHLHSSPSNVNNLHNHSSVVKMQKLRDFPSGPVVTTPCFQHRGHRFDSWSRKSPHTTGRLSPCITITEPECLEPVFPNKRIHHNEKPAHLNQRKPHVAAKTQCSQQVNNSFKKILKIDTDTILSIKPQTVFEYHHFPPNVPFVSQYMTQDPTLHSVSSQSSPL